MDRLPCAAAALSEIGELGARRVIGEYKANKGGKAIKLWPTETEISTKFLLRSKTRPEKPLKKGSNRLPTASGGAFEYEFFENSLLLK